MRSAKAKVQGGKIVTRAKFPEGTKLLLVVDEPAAPIALDPDDERAFEAGLAEVRAGRGIPLATFRAILQRL
jgi:hypothetical protein